MFVLEAPLAILIERRPAAAQERLAPAGECGRCHTQRARDQLQVLAAQETQHPFPLARPGHPPATAEPGAVLAGSPSARPLYRSTVVRHRFALMRPSAPGRA